MEGLVKGDGRVVCRPYPDNPAPRPPKSPSFPSSGCPPLDRAGSYTCYKKFPHNASQNQHQRTPSASFVMGEQPSWLDDLLDDTDNSANKSFHRRSASDSFTFLEAPGTLYKISDIAEEEELDCSAVAVQQTTDFTDGGFSDTGQLMSLLAEVEQLQRKHNLPLSITSAHCKPEHTRIVAVDNASASDCCSSSGLTGALNEGSFQHFLCDLETHVIKEKEQGAPWSEQIGAWNESTGHLDPNGDSRGVKRQSAQRSRVRKLQYIAELEKTVNSLETAISTLSPQVAYLENKRMVLNMGNNYLKMRVAHLEKEQKLKYVQNESLIKEVQKWRKLYQFQLQDNRQLSQQEVQFKALGHIRRHNSLPSDLDIPLEEFGKLSLKTPLYTDPRLCASNAFVGLVKNSDVVPRGTAVTAGTSCCNRTPDSLISSTCPVALGSKTL